MHLIFFFHQQNGDYGGISEICGIIGIVTIFPLKKKHKSRKSGG